MKVIKTNKPTFFDVDETLVISVPKGQVDDKCININGTWWRPHERHIHQMKAHKSRKHTIIVWSKGNDPWAEIVIKTLGLEDCVDYVMDKGQWFYDDNNSWMEFICYPPYDMEEDWEKE